MNLFLFFNLLVVFTNLILILILLIYGKQKMHRIWILCNLVVLMWGVGTVIIGSTTNLLLINIGWRLALVGGYFIGVLYYHTIYVFTSNNNKRFLILSYIFISLSAIGTLFASNIVIPHFKLMFHSIYFPQATAFFSIIYFGWILIATAASIELYKYMKTATGIRVIQSKYILAAFIIGFFGGGSTLWPCWGVAVYPIGNLGTVLYVIIVTYAILRHQLMDIEVFIKKSLVFTGMFICSFGAFVTVTLLISQIFGGANRILSLAISAFIIVLGMNPLERFLVNATDKFLFQKKYDYKQILKAFIDEVITVLNLDEIVNSTIKLLDQTLHPRTVSVFILNKVADNYQLYDSLGLDKKDILFTSDSKLINHFKKTRSPAIIKQVDGIAGVNPEVQGEMNSLEAIICLPLMLHDDLIGFISLGKKKSDEDYTKDDLDVLLDLARTESIAVGNAQLLTEAAQAERRAAIGTMSAGINHEIGNPLNIMATKIQVFKIARQKGLLRDIPVEDALNQAEEALDECLKQSGRIAEITKKLANFAKPSKEFKPQLVNISEEVGETLSMVGHDLELGKIKIVKNYSADLFKILADKREMQQIFFNIIRNAAQAIEGPGMITVSVFNNGSKARIEIQDTGKGIPFNQRDEQYMYKNP